MQKQKMGLIVSFGSFIECVVHIKVSLVWWSWYYSVYVICCSEECVRWRNCEEMPCGSRVGWW